MTAIRIIDDHLELENIGTNSHAQIDTHIAAADDYVKRDGSLALTSDWDIGDTRKILADEIRARDGAGLKLYDDGGNGIFIGDGGNVGIGTTSLTSSIALEIVGKRMKINSGQYAAGTEFTANGNVRMDFKAGGPDKDAGMTFNSNNKEDFTMGISNDGSKDFFMIGRGNDVPSNINADFAIDNTGNIGIGTATQTAALDINSDILRLRTAKTPASAGAAGNTGDMGADANYIYRCVSTNSWKRAALNVW